MTAAYHPSADGQAERTNQSVEIVLRCLLYGNLEEHWPETLPDVKRHLNSLRNANTDTTAFVALYGYEPQTQLNRSAGATDIETFIANRENIQKDLETALELANAKMAAYFDINHRPPHLSGRAYIKLTKAGKAGY